MTHPLALQPRSAIGELGNFLACETAAAQGITPRPAAAKPPVLSAADVATKLEPPKRCSARPGAHRRESLPYVGARRAAGVRIPPIAGFIRKLGKRRGGAPFSSVLILDPRE